MGVVYRADDIWLDRPVAVKVVDPQLAFDEAAARSFQQEARALAQIRHDNVVHVYTFGKHEGAFYFAMEYVDGISLEEEIAAHALRGETIEVGRAVKLFRAIARGLAAVHDRRLIHRDIKPGNVVLEGTTQRPVIVDFGLARRLRASNPRMTTTAGTPWYMAPEQARGDANGITAAADIYALACTAFELFTGRGLFEGEDIYEVLLAHMNDAPPRLSAFRPELAPLDPVLARALSKSPKDRYENCGAFIADFDHAMSGPTSRPSQLPPPTRRAATDALRCLLLATDTGLARSIVRTAERELQGPALERFTSDAELVGAFEKLPAQIVVLDEDAAQRSPSVVIPLLRRLAPSVEVIVLTRNWDSQRTQLMLPGVRELPKPLNMQVLGSVLRGARDRCRQDVPPLGRL